MHPIDLAYLLVRSLLGAVILYFAIRCVALISLGLYDAFTNPPI